MTSQQHAVLGIRPEAMASWLALAGALDRMLDDGRVPMCSTDPERWHPTTDRAGDPEAAEACTWCPAKRQCAAFAEANGERSGVWGGVDRTPRRGRPKNPTTPEEK